MAFSLGRSSLVTGAIDRATIRTAAPFSVVVAEGDPGEGLFLVQAGSLLATVEVAERVHVVDELGPGALFGELSSMRPGARIGATVTAVRASSLAFLPAQRIGELMAVSPPFATAIVAALDTQQHRIIQALGAALAA
jgi:CRP-like cAMP-binding protein